ncbi:MAG: D-alanine--D-alanine ligase [Deltaproteobacteria bacterium]|nr:D-alanine--D-alanine ligase [Deltaproteobacteria bacterium]
MSGSHPYLGAKVAVLCGGLSAERSVSLQSGRLVAEALRRRGHRVELVDVRRNLAQILRQRAVEVCFNALHGTYGEDGCVQGTLELLGIPYTGSGPLASALAFDKEQTKRLLQQAGLPTPTFEVLFETDQGAEAASRIGYPLVVKPPCQGSSVGVTIVHAPGELDRALATAASYGDGRVILERWIDGAEVTVGVLDGKALGTTEIVPAEPFYDYHAKYDSEATRYYSPARLAPETLGLMHRLGEEAVFLLGCGGAPRVDFIIDRAGSPHILEVNTLPGMTSHSLLPMCARLQGIGYDELCDEILALARLWVAEGGNGNGIGNGYVNGYEACGG